MKTFTQTMYIHESSELSDEDCFVGLIDMTDYGYVLLGTQDVELIIPKPPSKEIKLKALCDKLARSEEDHHKATCDIEDEIKKLESEE